jgi:hypothetical protein
VRFLGTLGGVGLRPNSLDAAPSRPYRYREGVMLMFAKVLILIAAICGLLATFFGDPT